MALKTTVKSEPIEWLMEVVNSDKVSIARLISERKNLIGQPRMNECVTFHDKSVQDRNRFANIPCLDVSRVRLRVPRDGSDYVHANHVSLPRMPCPCIVTQTPLSNTNLDFWSIVWEQNVQVIANLNHGKVRKNDEAQLYWANEIGKEHHKTFDNFKLRAVYAEINSYFELRVLEITNQKTGEQRNISHFVYNEWSDNAAPASTNHLLQFITIIKDEINNCQQHFNITPVRLLLHDMGGIGRPGAFLTLMSQMNKVDHREKPDILLTVNELRRQRALSIPNSQLYFYIHYALAKYILNNLEDPVHVRQHIESQLKTFKTTLGLTKITKSCNRSPS